MLKELSSRAFDFKCFWSGKEEITAFHIHILYFDWLQTNLRERPEYQLVCAWELTLEYGIRRVCHMIKLLLTPPQLWWNLNCLFPLPSAFVRGTASDYNPLFNDGWPLRMAQGTGQRWADSRARAQASRDPWSASLTAAAPFISSHPRGFNIMVERKSLLVLHWPRSLVLLPWAIWTRAGELAWKAGRCSGKREAPCFDWCNHHRLLHWLKS